MEQPPPAVDTVDPPPRPGTPPRRTGTPAASSSAIPLASPSPQRAVAPSPAYTRSDSAQPTVDEWAAARVPATPAERAAARRLVNDTASFFKGRCGKDTGCYRYAARFPCGIPCMPSEASVRHLAEATRSGTRLRTNRRMPCSGGTGVGTTP